MIQQHGGIIDKVSEKECGHVVCRIRCRQQFCTGREWREEVAGLVVGES